QEHQMTLLKCHEELRQHHQNEKNILQDLQEKKEQLKEDLRDKTSALHIDLNCLTHEAQPSRHGQAPRPAISRQRLPKAMKVDPSFVPNPGHAMILQLPLTVCCRGQAGSELLSSFLEKTFGKPGLSHLRRICVLFLAHLFEGAHVVSRQPMSRRGNLLLLAKCIGSGNWNFRPVSADALWTDSTVSGRIRHADGTDRPLLVLEDDAAPTAEFCEVLDQALATLPADADLLYLGYSQAADWRREVSRHVVESHYVWTTVAYIVWPQGARKMLSHLPVNEPVDNWMAGLCAANDIKAYCVRPKVVLQADAWNVNSDVAHSDEHYWGPNSDIQHSDALYWGPGHPEAGGDPKGGLLWDLDDSESEDVSESEEL
ncbi:Esterase, partial [Durusdinium trenchii]